MEKENEKKNSEEVAEEAVKEKTKAAEPSKETENKEKKSGKKKTSQGSKTESEKAKLLKELEAAKKQAEEYKTSWYRSAADFENFRKRNQESRANAYQDGKGDAIKSMLVIGDNLDRALLSVKDESTKEGIELVIKQYGEIMKNMGVEEINPVGEVFDPNVHEAVHQVEPEEGDESGKIKAVFRKGYSLNGKMLRYAQVVVIK